MFETTNQIMYLIPIALYVGYHGFQEAVSSIIIHYLPVTKRRMMKIIMMTMIVIVWLWFWPWLWWFEPMCRRRSAYILLYMVMQHIWMGYGWDIPFLMGCSMMQWLSGMFIPIAAVFVSACKLDLTSRAVSSHREIFQRRGRRAQK